MRTTIGKILHPLLGRPALLPPLGKWNPHGTFIDINRRIDMANNDNCYVDMNNNNNATEYTLQDETASESDKLKYTTGNTGNTGNTGKT
jgi:hypothetical protein